MKKTPQIRFKEYTEDWEQRKLGNCSELITKGTTPSSFCEDGDVTFVKIEALREKRVIKKLCSAISEEIHKGELTRSILKENDIVFAIAGATVGKCAVITRDILPANTNQALAIIRLKPSIDRDFVYVSLTSKQMEIYINQSKSVGAQPNLSLAQMNAFEFLCPCKQEEQQKIGDYFCTLDHLITLHQRKCEEIKKLKKFMLKKMFPQNGTNVPEIRFDDFTDAWEQRKFGEFARRESDFRISSFEYPSVEYEDVVAEEGRLNKDIRLKEVQKTGINFDGSQVLYGKLRPYLHNWINPDFKGVAVGDWWVLRPIDMNKNFLYRLIQTREFDEVANQSSGSKMPRADWNLISNTEFITPVSFEEQSRIAKFFDKLDSLITLHQREVEAYEKMKQYMLRNMFV